MTLGSKVFGVSLATILLVIAVVIITRMFGNSIPVVSSIGS